MPSSPLHSKYNQLYTISDLEDYVPPKFYRIIASGVLNIQNKMVLFGDEGSWKSVTALHAAHCIARGSKWFGFYTYPSNIYRLQVELPIYIEKQRTLKYVTASRDIFLAGTKCDTPNAVDKLAIAAGHYACPDNVVSRSSQFIHIDESFGWESVKKDIIACITELPKAPLVVIFDPLAMMFNGDLSSEADVKPLCAKIDILMDEMLMKYSQPVSFIIVHHTRKSQVNKETGLRINQGSEDATGSRHLVRWADTVLRCDLADNDGTKSRVKLYFTKHRNAEELLPEIKVRWDRKTLHPRILYRGLPKDITEEDETDLRDFTLLDLE